MKVAITGAYGFLGWHVACRLRALHGVDVVRLGRKEMLSPERLRDAVYEADAILHLAGVNRAESGTAVEEGNVEIARRVADAVVARARPIRVVYANSIQANLDNPYGRGKCKAATLLTKAAAKVDGRLVDVLLPNLFGEHGRPHYNSFVATFCQVIADGASPTVKEDRRVPLLHAQDAAKYLIEALYGTESGSVLPTGDAHQVSEVLTLLEGFNELYQRGEIPDLNEPFCLNLFNTFRSYVFPRHFPIYPQRHVDSRGELVEAIRSHGGTGQAFVSTTHPGHTRGEHYHLRKVERFFVLRGQAEISLRRLLHSDVMTFRLDGSRPGIVDMPTMWVHNITNVGDDELVTMFWSDQLLDPSNSDQYAETVAPESDT